MTQNKDSESNGHSHKAKTADVSQFSGPGPEVIKLFSHSTHKICPAYKYLIANNVNSFLRNIAEHENVSANKYENANYCWHFHIY